MLFDRTLTPELLALTGDRGARGVVEHDPARVSYVDIDRRAPRDVDTAGTSSALSAEFVSLVVALSARAGFIRAAGRECCG